MWLLFVVVVVVVVVLLVLLSILVDVKRPFTACLILDELLLGTLTVI